DEEALPVRSLDLHDLADAALALPPARELRIEPELPSFLFAERVRVQRDRLVLPHGDATRYQDHVALPPERRAEEARVERRDRAADRTPTPRSVADRQHARPLADALERPPRDLLQADDLRPV